MLLQPTLVTFSSTFAFASVALLSAPTPLPQPSHLPSPPPTCYTQTRAPKAPSSTLPGGAHGDTPSPTLPLITAPCEPQYILAGLLRDVPGESLPGVLTAPTSALSLRVPTGAGGGGGETLLRPFSRALPVQVLVGDHSHLVEALLGPPAQQLPTPLGLLPGLTGTCTCGSLHFTVTTSLPPAVHTFTCPSLASGRPLLALPRGCLSLVV